MSKIKVLLVDDEIDFLELMSLRISGWGYDALKASSGREAIEAVKNNCPDIVILDYMMPEMNGAETLREIRKISSTMQVVMFTAHADEKTIAETEKLGVYAFIPKTSVYQDARVTLKSVLATISKNLDGKQ